MIAITERAFARFRELLDEGDCIRLYLSAGGYNPLVALEIVRSAEKDDKKYEQDNYVFYLDKEVAGLPEIAVDHEGKKGFMISGLPKSCCCNAERGW